MSAVVRRSVYNAQRRLLHVRTTAFHPVGSTVRPITSPLPPPLPSPSPPSTDLNFDDVRESFASKTDVELLRALFVFRICTIRPIVARADALLHLSTRVLGKTLTSALMKRTFFAQFCAGENAAEVAGLVDRLERNGLGGILDFAAEADVAAEKGGTGHAVAIDATAVHQKQVWARATQLFAESIVDAGKRTDGFAAIKITAMGSPELLQSVTDYIVAHKRLFRAISNGTRYEQKRIPHIDANERISLQLFMEGVKLNTINMTESQARQCFKAVAGDDATSSTVDYIEWCRYFDPIHAPSIGIDSTLSSSFTLSSAARAEFAELSSRVNTLGIAAAKNKVRLLVDAEQTYLQPAIDYLTLCTQRLANQSFPYVYNTYQCYLLDTFSRLRIDMQIAKREGWLMAAKTVRGAYMRQERKRAIDMQYEDPIQPDFASTTSNYHNAVKYLLERLHAAHVVVAGHNESTVKYITSLMSSSGIARRNGGVYFGQLLGMCDHVSYALSGAGYAVVKVCPYGSVSEVMPYLIRRAQENADVLDRATKEKQLLWKEIIRRRAPFLTTTTATSSSIPSSASSSSSSTITTDLPKKTHLVTAQR